jgi:hypothetical protein
LPQEFSQALSLGARKPEVIMAEELFAKIVTLALSDRAFRDGLAASPQRTLANAGFTVTPDQLNTIVLAKPAEWGNLTLQDIIVRIDTFYKKR